MDTAQWFQEADKAEAAAATAAPKISERKIRRRNDQKQLKCPRCSSNNTKFCYYNNYSLTQPRYFCKTCRRYWTEGGSLRNVPVGGGSRKNKRANTATSSFTPSSSMQNPRFSAEEIRDLNLGFRFQQVGGITERDVGSSFMHEVYGGPLGFRVGAGGAADHVEGGFLVGSSAPRGGVLEQDRRQGEDTQGLWNGMLGNGGNW